MAAREKSVRVRKTSARDFIALLYCVEGSGRER
jgi:hypothetical protein